MLPNRILVASARPFVLQRAKSPVKFFRPEIRHGLAPVRDEWFSNWSQFVQVFSWIPNRRAFSTKSHRKKVTVVKRKNPTRSFIFALCNESLSGNKPAQKALAGLVASNRRASFYERQWTVRRHRTLLKRGSGAAKRPATEASLQRRGFHEGSFVPGSNVVWFGRR